MKVERNQRFHHAHIAADVPGFTRHDHFDHVLPERIGFCFQIFHDALLSPVHDGRLGFVDVPAMRSASSIECIGIVAGEAYVFDRVDRRHILLRNAKVEHIGVFRDP